VKSIRIFLVVVLLATMTLTVFLSALHGYRSSRAEVQALFDAELADRAHLLAITGDSRASGSRVVTVTEQYAFQLWRGDELLLRSDNTPETPIPVSEAGYQDRNFGGHRWRIYTWIDNGRNIRAMAAARVDIRNAVAEGIIMESVVPVIAALPIAGILIWFVVGYGLSPLSNLAKHLRSRRADELSPLPMERQPTELMQLVSSTNDLLGRLEASFVREKRFSSDAAHELRTPISALKVHLHNISQALPRGDSDLKHMEAAVDRMGNLVEQMLVLYRTSPDHYMAQLRELDLHQLVQGVIVEMYPGFEAKDIHLELTGGSAGMSGDQFALETLVKNLLDNACKYTPRGGRALVSVSGGKDDVMLRVDDSGPGVPQEQHERIFDRFYRLGGDQHESGVIGCGLGLAIARHIADLHGASIVVRKSASMGGLSVAVYFPHPGRRDHEQAGAKHA